MEDVVRFNEGVDQLVIVSVTSFVGSVNASRDCFLGILGHDLRNPLAAALLVAYLLAESTNLDPESLRMAGTLRASLDAIDELVRNLLDFTGTRLGAKMVVHPSPTSLTQLCEEVIVEMRTAYPGSTFDFRSASDQELVGEWDRGRLRQMISNLLGNAVQHGYTTTPITLTAACDGAFVNLAVQNLGTPIPEAALATIFDPMRRHRPFEKTDPPGSVGLGLYIAREVANAHGGNITVVSAGEETVFRVQLPRRFQSEPVTDRNARPQKNSLEIRPRIS